MRAPGLQSHTHTQKHYYIRVIQTYVLIQLIYKTVQKIQMCTKIITYYISHNQYI